MSKIAHFQNGTNVNDDDDVGDVGDDDGDDVDAAHAQTISERLREIPREVQRGANKSKGGSSGKCAGQGRAFAKSWIRILFMGCLTFSIKKETKSGIRILFW